jgi:Bacteriocin class II with double-glycine leader peptide
MESLAFNNFTELSHQDLLEISGGGKSATGYVTSVIGGASAGALLVNLGTKSKAGAGLGAVVGGLIGGYVYSVE